MRFNKGDTIMVDRRNLRSHPDAIKYYTEMVVVSRRKLEEALSELNEYAEQLRRVTEDAQQRLLTRE